VPRWEQKESTKGTEWFAMQEEEEPAPAMLPPPPAPTTEASKSADQGTGFFDFLNASVGKQAARQAFKGVDSGDSWYAMRSADTEPEILMIGAGDADGGDDGHYSNAQSSAAAAAARAAAANERSKQRREAEEAADTAAKKAKAARAAAEAAEVEEAAAKAAEEMRNFRITKQDLRAIFDTLDVNHDGSITHAEFIKGLRKYPEIGKRLGLHSQGLHHQEGTDRDEYVRKFTAMDVDGSHSIDFKEMLKYYTPWLADR